MEHGTSRPLCQILVCGVHVLDGTETHEDVVQRKRTHSGTGRSLSTRASSSDMMVLAPARWLTRLDHSVFNPEPGRCQHRAGSETREINEVDWAGSGSGIQDSDVGF